MVDIASGEALAIDPSVTTLSPEQRATEIIREQAARHAVSESNPNARHILIPRPEGYVHPFDRVYYAPYETEPDVDLIKDALGKALNGEENFSGLVDTLVASEDFRESLKVIEQGGKVAALGAHRELFDTCAMQAAYLVAAHELDPDILPGLIQGSRIIVGQIMAELALRSLSEDLSTIDSLRFLGGVFKAFPDTESTRQNIKEKGLDAKLVKRTNIEMASTFRKQVRAGDVDAAFISASGTTDFLRPRADGEGQEYVLQRASDGTDNMLREFDVWLPIVMQLSPKPVYRVGELIPHSEERRIHQVMAGPIVKLCCELNADEGIRTVYEEPLLGTEQKLV